MGLNQMEFAGTGDGGCSVFDTKFADDVADMLFGCAFGNDQTGLSSSQ